MVRELFQWDDIPHYVGGVSSIRTGSDVFLESNDNGMPEWLAVRLVDWSDNYSPLVIVPVRPFPRPGEGEACDSRGLANRCADGGDGASPMVCGPRGICQPQSEARCESCSEDIPLLPHNTRVEGQAYGPYSLWQRPCRGRGPEQLFRLELHEPSRVILSTDFRIRALTDTVLFALHHDCQYHSEWNCNDDVKQFNHASTLVVERANPGVYYVVVDTWLGGRFHLQATVESL
jgi:hypothetical protein